jgi:hypothetical protein
MQKKFAICFLLLAILGAVSGLPIKMADNMLDLSYAFVGKNSMPYFPNNKVFNIKPIFVGTITIGYNKL